MLKKIKALFLLTEGGLFQMMYKATPIARYRTVQTGAKRLLGGLKEGFSAFTYQPDTPSEVAIPLMTPTATGISKQIASESQFIFLAIVMNTILVMYVYNEPTVIRFKKILQNQHNKSIEMVRCIQNFIIFDPENINEP